MKLNPTSILLFSFLTVFYCFALILIESTLFDLGRNKYLFEINLLLGSTCSISTYFLIHRKKSLTGSKFFSNNALALIFMSFGGAILFKNYSTSVNQTELHAIESLIQKLDNREIDSTQFFPVLKQFAEMTEFKYEQTDTIQHKYLLNFPDDFKIQERTLDNDNYYIKQYYQLIPIDGLYSCLAFSIDVATPKPEKKLNIHDFNLIDLENKSIVLENQRISDTLLYRSFFDSGQGIWLKHKTFIQNNDVISLQVIERFEDHADTHDFFASFEKLK